ncbi:MAG: transcriptional repressor [Acidimicrobiia bacterium]|nr:transcriptional repressor [Acidimicrobiia bacterium]
MAAPELHDVVSTRLRSAEQRYTPGRRRLVSLLAGGGGPMTIPEVLERDGSLAQSSVYRNLGVLEEAGVVVRIVTTDDFARYELAEDLTEHHHHLVCSRCGSVADFSLDPDVESELARVLRRAARRASFTIEHHRLDLVGVCGSCR